MDKNNISDNSDNTSDYQEIDYQEILKNEENYLYNNPLDEKLKFSEKLGDLNSESTSSGSFAKHPISNIPDNWYNSSYSSCSSCNYYFPSNFSGPCHPNPSFQPNTSSQCPYQLPQEPLKQLQSTLLMKKKHNFITLFYKQILVGSLDITQNNYINKRYKKFPIIINQLNKYKENFENIEQLEKEEGINDYKRLLKLIDLENERYKKVKEYFLSLNIFVNFPDKIFNNNNNDVDIVIYDLINDSDIITKNNYEKMLENYVRKYNLYDIIINNNKREIEKIICETINNNSNNINDIYNNNSESAILFYIFLFEDENENQEESVEYECKFSQYCEKIDDKIIFSIEKNKDNIDLVVYKNTEVTLVINLGNISDPKINITSSFFDVRNYEKSCEKLESNKCLSTKESEDAYRADMLKNTLEYEKNINIKRKSTIQKIINIISKYLANGIKIDEIIKVYNIDYIKTLILNNIKNESTIYKFTILKNNFRHTRYNANSDNTEKYFSSIMEYISKIFNYNNK